MSRRTKITPILDEKITKSLNLTVLQRADPFVEEILLTAAHVSLYQFDIGAFKWSRREVEGSLFVVKRNAQPRFQFVIMNRKSTDNLVENLMGSFEYEVQLPYLLYKNDAQEVLGIWFYDSRECEAVAKLFTRIINVYPMVSSLPEVAPGKSQFEEPPTVPSMAMAEGLLEPLTTNSGGPQELSVTNLEGPSESLKTNPTSTTFQEDSTLMSILSAVMSIGGDSIVANSTQVCSAPSTNLSPAQIPNLVPSLRTTPQMPSLHHSAPSPSMALHEVSDPINSGNLITNLVTPSSFLVPPSNPYPLIMTPISSTKQLSTAHNPALSLLHQGAPLLQHFPPPSPPLSLSFNAPLRTVFQISKEEVRNALLMLVKDEQFVDAFYRALLKAHQS